MKQPIKCYIYQFYSITAFHFGHFHCHSRNSFQLFLGMFFQGFDRLEVENWIHVSGFINLIPGKAKIKFCISGFVGSEIRPHHR